MNTHSLDIRSQAICSSRPVCGVSIERAVLSDASFLRALHELSLATMSVDAYSPEQIHGLFMTRNTAPVDMLAAGRMHIARRHGFVVGSAGWEPRVIDGCEEAHIRSVFVHPLQTRQGIASALVRAVEEDAMGRGVRRFTLTATLNAVPLYRRLGYATEAPGELDLGCGLTFPMVSMSRTVDSDQPAGNLIQDAEY